MEHAQGNNAPTMSRMPGLESGTLWHWFSISLALIEHTVVMITEINSLRVNMVPWMSKITGPVDLNAILFVCVLYNDVDTTALHYD